MLGDFRKWEVGFNFPPLLLIWIVVQYTEAEEVEEASARRTESIAAPDGVWMRFKKSPHLGGLPEALAYPPPASSPFTCTLYTHQIITLTNK